jgi:DHA1 family multidrug resistance protein-like MFS transporter
MPFDSARSSITIIDGDSQHTRFVDRDLEQEIAREEKNFEAYGGDDPHEPENSDDKKAFSTQEDPNRVTWDGPNDPTNPQNWSKTRKWLITVLCCIMTVNVYVALAHLTCVYS